MKAILQKVISRTATIIKGMFTARQRQQERKPKVEITKLKPHELYTNKIFTVLKGNPDFPVPPIYKSELKMVYRRLVQYQRLRWHGSHAEKAAALKKLNKEWYRLQRNHLRKIKSAIPHQVRDLNKKEGRIIPISSAKE